VGGPFGDDYLAAAAPRSRTPGLAQALVLVVNRPSPLLDPVAVRLRISASRSLGAPVLRTLANPLAPSAAHAAPALCDLGGHGSAIAGSQLQALGARGGALPGFDAAGAVAQAYDLSCGLPYASAFRLAVQRSAAPRCAPCDPPPGYACPDAPAPSICAAPAASAARRTLAGAH